MRNFLRVGLLLIAITSVTSGWPTDGKGVCVKDGMQILPGIIDDGAGGAVIYWIDTYFTNPPPIEGGYEVWAKRIDADGNTYGSWPSQGKAVSIPPWPFDPNGHRLSPVGVKSGNGGIILSWVNHKTLSYLDPEKMEHHYYYSGVWCQKLSSNNGSFLWSDSAIRIGNYPYPSSICSDGAGGMICGYIQKSGEEYKIMAEKRNASGDSVWAVTVRSDNTVAKSPKVVPTSDSGVWVSLKTPLIRGNNLLSFLRRKYE